MRTEAEGVLDKQNYNPYTNRLIFKVFNTVHLVAVEATVNVDDNRNRNGTFGSTDSNGEEAHEHTLKLTGEEQAVECSEIQIDSIKHQLNRDEHGDKVTAGDEAEHADEEQQCAKHEITFYWYQITVSPFLFLILLFRR